MTLKARLSLAPGRNVIPTFLAFFAHTLFFSAQAQQPSFADLLDRLRPTVVTVASAVIDKTPVAKKKKTGLTDERKPMADDEQGLTDDFTQNLLKRKPGERARQLSSVGSGFIIDASGLIVTNNHVIEGGEEVYVVFNDGQQLKVDKVLGRDLKTDITLLKVSPSPDHPLKATSFGNSAAMRVGDWVIAIGNPFGLGGTVTAGILSGTGRDINAGPYDEFLQTDAAINRGNSGGPLFNASGEVIGVNTAIFSPTGGSIGLGFAIPSNTVKRVVEQLQRYGETHWGSIGIRIQSVSDDLAVNLGLSKPEGALVARVDHGGPAEMAGLSEGDVILEFAGAPILHSKQLPRVVAQAPVGDEVEMRVLRRGEQKTIRVRVALLSDKRADEKVSSPISHAHKQKLRGVELQSLSDETRKRYALGGDVEGVVVTDVSPDVSAQQGLKPGDVVVEAAHRKVRGVEELDERIETLRQSSRSQVLLTIDRGGSFDFVLADLSDD